MVRKSFNKIPAAILIGLIAFIATVFVLPCLPAQAADTPECWGVIVGISNFEYINDLNYADDNARDLYENLSPVWGESHIKLLIDSEAAKSDILNAIKWMAGKADTDDTVLFDFSGHGSDGGYICPYDTYVSLSTCISASELTNSFKSVKAKKIVVILDSCYSGDFKDSLSTDTRVILMATDPDELGWEDGAIMHSVFTYYLLSALDNFDEVDTNHDYELSAEELFAYVAPLVEAYEEANNYPSIQHPTISDTYLREIALLARFMFALNTLLPPGTSILSLDGIEYFSLPLPLLWIPGSEHTLVIPQIVDTGVGTRYVFINWSDGDTSDTRVISKGSYTANYDKEQLLDMISSYGDTAGAGWYKDSSTADFSVTPYVETPDTKHFFTQWSGDFTGTSSTGSLVMDTPKTVTANWRNEYLLSINSPYSESTGSGWYNENTIANFSINPYVETSDTRRYFTSWSGDFTGTDSSAMVYMDTPKTVIAHWRSEYLLTVNSEYGNPVGTGWYREDETAAVSVEPVQGFLIRHIFTEWSGDLNVTQSNYHLSMNSPKVITANWRTDYVQLYILIGVVVILGVAVIITITFVRGRHVVFK